MLPPYVPCVICTTFDLWMSRVGHDTWLLASSMFYEKLWMSIMQKPMSSHVTMGVFELSNIAKVAMANQIRALLKSFGLLDKVIVYIKNEGSNLSTLIVTFTIVVFCFSLQLACPFKRSCFGHAMLKAS